MTQLTITSVAPSQIFGTLSNDQNRFSIPLRIEGAGMAHFRKNNLEEKILELSPDVINVSKNNAFVFAITEIKVTRIFGKNLLEGVDMRDGKSPVVIDLSKIKQMWTNSYSRHCDVWNIEV